MSSSSAPTTTLPSSLELTSSWSPPYLVASIVLSIVGATFALEFVKHRTSSVGCRNSMLLLCASIAYGGLSCWSAHVTTMISHSWRAPDGNMLQGRHMIEWVIVAAAMPIVTSIIAFGIIGQHNDSVVYTIFSGVLIGVGIVGMHYVIMLNHTIIGATYVYDLPLVAATITVGIVTSVGVMFAYDIYHRNHRKDWRAQLALSVCMGVTIVGVKCVGLQSIRYYTTSSPPAPYPSIFGYTGLAPLSYFALALLVSILLVLVVIRLHYRRLERHDRDKIGCITLCALITNAAGDVYVSTITHAPPCVVIAPSWIGKKKFDATNPCFLRMYRTSFDWTAMYAYLQQQRERAAHDASARKGSLAEAESRFALDIYAKFVAAAEALAAELQVPTNLFGKIYWNTENSLITIVFDPDVVAGHAASHLANVGSPSMSVRPLASAASAASHLSVQLSPHSRMLLSPRSPRSHSALPGAFSASTSSLPLMLNARRGSRVADLPSTPLALGNVGTPGGKADLSTHEQSRRSNAQARVLSNIAAKLLNRSSSGSESPPPSTHGLQHSPPLSPSPAPLLDLGHYLRKSSTVYRFQSLESIDASIRLYLRLDDEQSTLGYVDALRDYARKIEIAFPDGLGLDRAQTVGAQAQSVRHPRIVQEDHAQALDALRKMSFTTAAAAAAAAAAGEVTTTAAYGHNNTREMRAWSDTPVTPMMGYKSTATPSPNMMDALVPAPGSMPSLQLPPTLFIPMLDMAKAKDGVSLIDVVTPIASAHSASPIHFGGPLVVGRARSHSHQRLMRPSSSTLPQSYRTRTMSVVSSGTTHNSGGTGSGAGSFRASIMSTRTDTVGTNLMTGQRGSMSGLLGIIDGSSSAPSGPASGDVTERQERQRSDTMTEATAWRNSTEQLLKAERSQGRIVQDGDDKQSPRLHLSSPPSRDPINVNTSSPIPSPRISPLLVPSYPDSHPIHLSVSLYYTQASTGRPLQVLLPSAGPYGMTPHVAVECSTGHGGFSIGRARMLLEALTHLKQMRRIERDEDTMLAPTASSMKLLPTPTIDVACDVVNDRDAMITALDQIDQAQSISNIFRMNACTSLLPMPPVLQPSRHQSSPSSPLSSPHHSLISSSSTPMLAGMDTDGSPSPMPITMPIPMMNVVPRSLTTSTPVMVIPTPATLIMAGRTISAPQLTMFNKSATTDNAVVITVDEQTKDDGTIVMSSHHSPAIASEPSSPPPSIYASFFNSCASLATLMGSSTDMTLSSLHPSIVCITPHVYTIAFVVCKYTPNMPDCYLPHSIFVPLPIFDIIHRSYTRTMSLKRGEPIDDDMTNNNNGGGGASCNDRDYGRWTRELISHQLSMRTPTNGATNNANHSRLTATRRLTVDELAMSSSPPTPKPGTPMPPVLMQQSSLSIELLNASSRSIRSSISIDMTPATPARRLTDAVNHNNTHTPHMITPSSNRARRATSSASTPTRRFATLDLPTPIFAPSSPSIIRLPSRGRRGTPSSAISYTGIVGHTNTHTNTHTHTHTHTPVVAVVPDQSNTSRLNSMTTLAMSIMRTSSLAMGMAVKTRGISNAE